MGGDQVREGDGGDGGDILDDLLGTKSKDRGYHYNEGEEDCWPVRYVGEEQVVDMDPSLGGKEEVKEKYEDKHTK